MCIMHLLNIFSDKEPHAADRTDRQIYPEAYVHYRIRISGNRPIPKTNSRIRTVQSSGSFIDSVFFLGCQNKSLKLEITLKLL